MPKTNTEAHHSKDPGCTLEILCPPALMEKFTGYNVSGKGFPQATKPTMSKYWRELKKQQHINAS